MLTLPKCEFCKRFIEETYTCEIFKDEIPDSVLWDPVEAECHDGMKFEEAPQS